MYTSHHSDSSIEGSNSIENCGVIWCVNTLVDHRVTKVRLLWKLRNWPFDVLVSGFGSNEMMLIPQWLLCVDCHAKQSYLIFTVAQWNEETER